jgi:hypothetical protein
MAFCLARHAQLIILMTMRSRSLFVGVCHLPITRGAIDLAPIGIFPMAMFKRTESLPPGYLSREQYRVAAISSSDPPRRDGARCASGLLRPM